MTSGLATLIVLGVQRWQRERTKPLGLRLGHLGPAVIIVVLALLGTIATITASFGGLYWLAGAMAAATTAGIINSWVLLVEIKR